MLEEVRIQGLGVIDDAVLELSPGLTVVTGETGAGKTMVVTGLGLLFGGRADPQRVRPGADRAVVEGRLTVPSGGRVAARVLEAGGDIDDDVLILTRTVSAEGRSRATMGGRSAPVSLLAYLADDLVAVHGQSDQQRLLRSDRQRSSLDRFAGEPLTKALKQYTVAYRRHREVSAELEELVEQARERAQEADMLRFGAEEIAAAEPRPGEDAELLAEETRLAHADSLRVAATTAHEALAGDPASDVEVDVAALLSAARQAVAAVREHDAELAAIGERLDEASYILTDAATELASYAESVDADPARLALVQERRALLTSLSRKYGATTDEVLAWAENAAKRLADLEGDDERIDALRAEADELHERMELFAAELTRVRTEAADRFGEAVTEELTALAMPHARVSVRITTGEEFGQHGRDEVEVLLAPHPSSPPLALHKGASGGELSRVMLAIEVVFAGADPVPTFVFDEVDAGVGGKAAVEIGRRLARLARRAQVIVVTHLPQVAAFADAHLVVEKSTEGLVTESGVVRLDRGGRVRELSRMLAGLEDSELGRAHAEELLTNADPERAYPAA
ncbi:MULTISPECIES: DNA repair protein RecN [Nocardiopsis]|uniref:DNA repair protein RecN n=1 Tax=Nocardiopsis dassonvillei (strain ATCC 23218 / DSM 43111 / CIP 107115 / JCM 7437 / KCTC 9190 / NBRC 14626 / NCTC 10488 / NRRL B-5397 / IMRU 509) TaxID=446468 RepID=D7B1K9_NOCDD|nr:MULTISPECIES: DNA repair protein RecN [Nocardiopsis]ADH68435.1 DNA repair protein RecN [Nocardiopsis dassonvillei subsp. dassonvillei DSM 43111]APC36529.1 DNA repair protein RecN [Nocardiopsis dassonvillei]NKY82297.1 DNA repair protein RecN [Nocardiopsis dassonvillei]VEI88940.1 Recombination protein N [Nocardiopsis dassonvillei]